MFEIPIKQSYRKPLSWLFIVCAVLAATYLVVITDRASVAMRQHRQQLEMYDAILDNENFAVVAVDEQARVVIWNSAASTLFGWTADEMLGNEIYCIFPPDLAEFHRKVFAKPIVSFERHEFKCRIKNRLGKLVDVALSVRTLPGGNVAKLVATVDSSALTNREPVQDEFTPPQAAGAH